MFYQDDSYFANLFMLTQERIDRLFKSFETAYPHKITLQVSADKFSRISADAAEISGEGHPETVDAYNGSRFNWSFWHSKIAHVLDENGLRLSVVLGFKDPADAMRFKLMWA